MAGIYVHIPFCRRKCKYCDFVSSPDLSKEDLYFVALISEIRMWKKAMEGFKFETVFIGGGTPTVLRPGKLAVLLKELGNSFDIAEDAEITCEANPESATEEKLAELRKAGVNRLSIGLQSADEIVLRRIGRIHTLSDFLTALEAAKKVGFTNINADVMHGLPGQTQESYLSTLRLLADLELPHISSYELILEEGTPLYAEVESGETQLPDRDLVADMQDAGMEYLASRGYGRYEISNFAKPGFECRHNLNYWNNGEYLGVGLNAHSALHVRGEWVRFSNTEDILEYAEKLGEGKFPVAETGTITRNEEIFETLMVGLRKVSGVSRRDFFDRFGCDPVELFAPVIAELELDEMMKVTEERMYLTKRGLDFQNDVLIRFMDQLPWETEEE